ncbi:MAG TPA: questin oxidase family protein, partial [Thermoanaerobaculia bacterium]|nr:questin oxidase family protein [Thermoanaerobaculia bacterium]
HMLTGCHAMRVLAPFLAPEALGIFATAVLAAYVAIGRPPITATLPDNVPDDATIAAQAVPSDDDHDLKLVYSALREEAEYGTGWHRLCAAVRLGLA